MNDHQGDGVTRVWLALVLLCRAAASFNKQFKSDSARLAFLVWVEFSDYGGQIECGGRVLHTLIGR
ncbi:hypothetical protein [Vibrio atlanticus]|uniref:hypothetical protein n=1 Tax=Vibrio atlanticus TaxID=693153 RepID=UPI00355170A6